jgi:hypothetical protein
LACSVRQSDLQISVNRRICPTSARLFPSVSSSIPPLCFLQFLGFEVQHGGPYTRQRPWRPARPPPPRHTHPTPAAYARAPVALRVVSRLASRPPPPAHDPLPNPPWWFPARRGRCGEEEDLFAKNPLCETKTVHSNLIQFKTVITFAL